MTPSIEERLCEKYIQRASDEEPLSSWLQRFHSPATVMVAEGFEERSLGVLEVFAQAKVEARRVVIGRYERNDDLNDRYRARFEELAQAVAPGRWEVLPTTTTAHGSLKP